MLNYDEMIKERMDVLEDLQEELDLCEYEWAEDEIKEQMEGIQDEIDQLREEAKEYKLYSGDEMRRAGMRWTEFI